MRRWWKWLAALVVVAVIATAVGVLVPQGPEVEAASYSNLEVSGVYDSPGRRMAALQSIYDSAYPVRYVGETTVAPTTWGYQYQLSNGDIVEVGDSATTDFKASVKTIRWDNVCWFNLGWAGGTFAPSLNDLTVSFDFNNSLSVSIYPREPCERLPEGGIEYDIMLSKKPAQTTITLDIDWQGITWEKILPLDVVYTEVIAEEDFGIEDAPYTITQTDVIGYNGYVYKHIEEYEVNSYLGTATTPHKDSNVMGWNPNTQQPMSYTTPSRTKLYIHRGEMTDALGQTAWVEDINIDEVNKTITFVLPRDWLSSKDRVYPVSQVCGVDPAYTQDMDSWNPTAISAWTNYDLFTEKSVPKGAVAEIIMADISSTAEKIMGVRTDGSGLTRSVTIHEPEAGGQTHCRMFVTNHIDTGIIEYYAQNIYDVFYVVGYWENVTFTELATAISADSSGGFVDETLAVGADVVHHIIMSNDEQDVANTMGVRANGSSLTRNLKVHEPEAGGSNFLDFLVKSDASKVIELYSEDATNATFIDSGYFGTELDFVELWQNITNDGDSDWDVTDLTAYLDQDGRMVDFLLTHFVETAEHTLGVRDGDDGATNRYLLEHEAESAGAGGEYTGFSMSAQTNASGEVQLYSSTTSEYFYLTGYFKPAAAGAYDIASIAPSGKSFGVVQPSTTYYAYGSAPSNPVLEAECLFILTNGGASACDIDVHGHNATGGVGWTLTSSSPGENTFRLTIYYAGQDPSAGIVITTVDQKFYDSLAVSGHFHFDFKFETGTFTDGVLKEWEITFTAVAET